MNIKEILSTTPVAVKRLGEEIFLKVPLYRSTTKITPIYINQHLFKELFPDASHYNAEEMQQFITDLFSTTINKEAFTEEQVGFAYVDKQADPLGLALGGNKGSGRAYYTGPYFNIKGEKTPLATSENESLADGTLKLELGIWSCLISNTLDREKEIKVSPVLALIDLNKTFTPTNGRLPHACIKVIRIDRDGSLDRVTHAFYKKTKLKESDFTEIVNNFSRLSAQKYMHRILHGSWSNGNISMGGHLIDLDTVCAVKGRQPQFSLTNYYLANYFGFEHQGLALVLKSLCEDKEINVEDVNTEKLDKSLEQKYVSECEKILLQLMGFSANNAILKKLNVEMSKLIETFIQLASITVYENIHSYNTNLPIQFFGHQVDFSLFFRVYPLIVLSNSFNVECAMQIMLHTRHRPNEEKTILAIKPEKQHEHIVEDRQSKLTPERDSTKITELLHQFVEKYHEFFQKAKNLQPLKMHEIAKRAYVINEDRFYLFPTFDIMYSSIAGKIKKSSTRCSQLLEQIIWASTRNADKNQADIRLFDDGCCYIEFTPDQSFKVCFELMIDKFNTLNIDKSKLYTIIENKNYVLTVKDTSSMHTVLETDPIHIENLPKEMTRDEVFLTRLHPLFSDGKEVELEDIFIGGKTRVENYFVIHQLD